MPQEAVAQHAERGEQALEAVFGPHDRLGTYHEEHSKTAWDRTVDFFKRHLSHNGSG